MSLTCIKSEALCQDIGLRHVSVFGVHPEHI